MEKACVTAAAVVAYGRVKMRPCEVATHAINWDELCRKMPDLPKGCNEIAQASSGAFDEYCRFFRGDEHVR